MEYAPRVEKGGGSAHQWGPETRRWVKDANQYADPWPHPLFILIYMVQTLPRYYRRVQDDLLYLSHRPLKGVIMTTGEGVASAGKKGLRATRKTPRRRPASFSRLAASEVSARLIHPLEIARISERL